jgi:hypothetical protein
MSEILQMAQPTDASVMLSVLITNGYNTNITCFPTPEENKL